MLLLVTCLCALLRASERFCVHKISCTRNYIYEGLKNTEEPMNLV